MQGACAVLAPGLQSRCPSCRKYGRKRTMLLAGVLFDAGVILTASAFSLTVLLLGRILLGVAVAFASVAVTLYNSEMAPAHIRGRLNQIFQAPHFPLLPSSLACRSVLLEHGLREWVAQQAARTLC